MLNVVDFVKKVLIGLIVLVVFGAAMLAAGIIVVKILMFLGWDVIGGVVGVGALVGFCWTMGDILVGTRKKVESSITPKDEGDK